MPVINDESPMPSAREMAEIAERKEMVMGLCLGARGERIVLLSTIYYQLIELTLNSTLNNDQWSIIFLIEVQIQK